MVKEVIDQNLEKEILKSDLPVLVDFWAPWCGPCVKIAPVIEKLSRSYKGKFKFCKVNVEEAQNTASKYGIMSIPTLMFFKKREVVDKIVGIVPESTIQGKIDTLLLLSNNPSEEDAK